MDFEDKLGCSMILALVVVMLVSIFGSLWLNYRNPETVEGVVVDSYIKRYGNSDYFHHVIQFDDGHKEVFQNRDAFWLGKFDSADVEQTIEIGQRYIFSVRGIRWPLISAFRNIISITPADL